MFQTTNQITIAVHHGLKSENLGLALSEIPALQKSFLQMNCGLPMAFPILPPLNPPISSLK